MIRLSRRAALALPLLATPAIARAQSWRPSGQVRIIVPAAAGGTTDIMGRLLAQFLQPRWGTPVVVENRTGAGGTIGTVEMVRARPDGLSLLMGNIGPQAIGYSLFRNLPYRPEQIAPIAGTIAGPNVLVVNNNVPAQNLQEFIAWVKANPGKVNYGSSGFGSSNHLVPELLNGRLGLTLVHVPFRGGAPALQALLAGQVQVMMENIPTKIGAIRAGQIRALAVTGRERDPSLPDVPTFAEAGVPGIVAEPWFGYMAPRGTPDAVVAGLNRILNEAIADPEVQRKLRDLGARPEGGPPERFAAHVRSEIARWREVVETNKIEKLN